MSAMKMEKNGKMSCGKRSQHMNIRYFWIKDYVARGKLDIVHCPTEFVKADTLSKPLQGALFRKFRAQQMNIPDGKELKAEQREAPPSPRSVLEISSVARTDVSNRREDCADVRDVSTARPGSDRATKSQKGSNRAQSTRDTTTSVEAISWDSTMVQRQKDRRPISRPRKINTSS